MAKLKTVHLLCAAATVSAWPLVVAAQQSPPAQSPPAGAPPLPKAEPAPQVVPPPSKAPAVKPSEAPAAQGLVGLNVFSADGTRVGEVQSVDTGPNGDIVALYIRTGGFLGFGGKVVAIPEGRFMRSGQSVRLDFDADQIDSLPTVKERP
ncbi:MAG TPA: PRC-barrel domain-containing protein [Hyphomicrobiaceae bacterium]|jgi:hypothetical protein|nr:PRC-barrel domain-containing protein [Hyphomicrobiaceae bacterium]